MYIYIYTHTVRHAHTYICYAKTFQFCSSGRIRLHSLAMVVFYAICHSKLEIPGCFQFCKTKQKNTKIISRHVSKQQDCRTMHAVAHERLNGTMG